MGMVLNSKLYAADSYCSGWVPTASVGSHSFVLLDRSVDLTKHTIQ